MNISFNDIIKMKHEDENKLYLVISGDRQFKPGSTLQMSVNGHMEMVTGSEVFDALIKRLTNKSISNGMTIDIRCGDNDGSDQLAVEWAKRNNYMFHVCAPNWSKGGASAAYKRNEDMFMVLGFKPHKGCLLLWDGENKMTRHLMFCAWCQSIPCRVWNYITRSWISEHDILEAQLEERSEQIKHGRYF